MAIPQLVCKFAVLANRQEESGVFAQRPVDRLKG
jgi:hypothetical protein